MKSKSKYEQLVEGEPFVVSVGRYVLDMACCDCGLVHRVTVKILSPRRVALTYIMDSRKTAAYRRHHGIDGSATVRFNNV